MSHQADTIELTRCKVEEDFVEVDFFLEFLLWNVTAHVENVRLHIHKKPIISKVGLDNKITGIKKSVKPDSFPRHFKSFIWDKLIQSLCHFITEEIREQEISA